MQVIPVSHTQLETELIERNLKACFARVGVTPISIYALRSLEERLRRASRKRGNPDKRMLIEFADRLEAIADCGYDARITDAEPIGSN